MAVLAEISSNVKHFNPMELTNHDEKSGVCSSIEASHGENSLKPTTPVTAVISSSRQPSPSLSSLSELSSISSNIRKATDPLTGAHPPAKRRKLTPAEKEQQRLEKEQKEKLRLEQKAQKEEERLVRDEERRQKNEIKEEKKREKELEKQQKEDEKRKKDEEKQRKEDERLKKENAQKKINNFFMKPTTPSKPALYPTISPGPKNAATNTGDITSESTCQDDLLNVSTTAEAAPLSDYQTVFLPFSLPSNSTCAPYNSFSWNPETRSHFERTVLQSFQRPESFATESITKALKVPSEERVRGVFSPSMRTIMSHIYDTTSSSMHTKNSAFWARPMDVLKRVSMKHIAFYEDIRPPYTGTYTKIQSQPEKTRLARNPFKKSRPDTNYEYDSEAEWEDPGEGEDLNSEGESDADSIDGTEEMDGFLDDEDVSEATAQRKRHIGGDLEPVCSGLCWEDSRGQLRSDSDKDLRNGLEQYRLDVIDDDMPFPIDPFSTAYWAPVASTEPEQPSILCKLGLMEPPKLPLQPKPVSIVKGARGRPPKNNKGPTKLLVGQELEDFKAAIDGSDLTKVGLIEILKKRFPKISKDSIKDTLNVVAARVGAKDADKKWVLLPDDKVAAA